MKKLGAGTKVRIRKDIRTFRRTGTGVYITEEMKELAGKIMVIDDCSGYSTVYAPRYKLAGDVFTWTTELFDVYTPDIQIGGLV